MDKKALPDWLFTIIALAAALSFSLYLRIVVPYPSVFEGQWIKLTTNDAYFYMRIVDNLLHNFPHLYAFDPYLLFPGGFSMAGFPPLFAYLLAGTVKLLGGPSPSQHLVDTIAVYIPAVIGILTVIPVYFIGKALINRWAGLAAAVLAATVPGELLTLSVLGNTDHHAAEILLTACFSLFFILSVKDGRQFTYNTLKCGRRSAAVRPLLYAAVAGIFMGFYLAMWTGAPLFVFLVLIYFIVQFISDHLRGFTTDYLSSTAIACFLIALIVFVSISGNQLTLLSLTIVILAPVALNVLSSLMTSRRMKLIYFPALVGVLAILGIAGAWLVFPALFKTVFFYFGDIFSWRVDKYVVGEMRPLFFPGPLFTFDMAWSQFALVLYTGLAGLTFMVCRCIRKGDPELIFVIVWTVVMMLAVFAMVRFSTYFSICLAVLTGWLAGLVVETFSQRELAEPARKPHRKARRIAQQSKTPLRLVVTALSVTVAVIVTLVPGTVLAVNNARTQSSTPGDAWMEAMEWMKRNTTEPFGSADYYYSLYESPAPGKAYVYPATAYGVVVWSDYGYWVTRIGHRIPTSNPGTYPVDESKYFTAQDEASTVDYLKKWQAKYVIIDNRIASPNDKFYALANLSGKKETDFYELCWQKKDEKYTPLLVFYPAYYRSTITRLFNFDGKQVVPENSLVMAYQERLLPDGQKFTEITGLKSFSSYGEADRFITAQKQGQYKIIGVDPLRSPIALEPLADYKLVYQSNQKSSIGSTPLPSVKVFQYGSSAN